MLILVLLCAGVVGGAYRVGAARADASGGDLPPEFDAVEELYGRLSAQALSRPADARLAQGALQGMVEALGDPYASYFSPSEFTTFNERLEGDFSGVGLVLERAPEGLAVVNVLPDSPAARAGVRVGERIVTVDGRDVRGEPIETVVPLVQGEVGSSVALGLEGQRAGVRTLTLRREDLQVPLLESRRLGNGAGYVRLLRFSRGAGAEVRAAVTRLRDEGATGFVLDLRGNPGGLLTEAIDVTSVFVDSGVVVSVRDPGSDPQVYRAQGNAVTDQPLVVLVDRGSASASEIVAGCVSDLARGELVGERTFGKGTVQTFEPLASGAGVKFTTAEYLTSSGDSIEGVGVTPDRVVVEQPAQFPAAEALLGELVR